LSYKKNHPILSNDNKTKTKSTIKNLERTLNIDSAEGVLFLLFLLKDYQNNFNGLENPSLLELINLMKKILIFSIFERSFKGEESLLSIEQKDECFRHYTQNFADNEYESPYIFAIPPAMEPELRTLFEKADVNLFDTPQDKILKIMTSYCQFAVLMKRSKDSLNIANTLIDYCKNNLESPPVVMEFLENKRHEIKNTKDSGLYKQLTLLLEHFEEVYQSQYHKEIAAYWERLHSKKQPLDSNAASSSAIDALSTSTNSSRLSF
jgi:hypothetical protein